VLINFNLRNEPASLKHPIPMNPSLQSLDELIDCEYGVVGTAERDAFEAGFDAFKTELISTETPRHT
jgi:hypothetical protein